MNQEMNQDFQNNGILEEKNKEFPRVPFLESYRSLLERCNVPQEYQKLIELWLGDSEEGEKTPLDFLQLLGDLLQTTETHLQLKRNELSKKLNSNKGIITPIDAPPDILALEETIKNSWSLAAALWLALDQVVRFPEEYSLALTRKHAEYAIQTKNLPLIELLKWNQPQFFAVKETSELSRKLHWVIGGIAGAFLGLIGGFLGGIKYAFQKPGLRKLLLPFYALLGMIMGWSNTAVRAARLGYRTGDFLLTCKLAFLTAYMSPFHAPRGSKALQAVELKIEETLFNESGKNEMNRKEKAKADKANGPHLSF